jgi:hypothetical protein
MVKATTEDVTAEIEAAAYDFARHTKGGGGWALGLSVAACVQPGTGNPAVTRNDRYTSGKVSAQEFAKLAGTSAPRVMRYMKAWENAAAKKLVAPPTELEPADWYDADHIPEGYEWGDFYDASESGSRPRDSKPEHAAQIIEKRGAEAVIAEMTDEQIEQVVEAAARTRQEPTQRGINKERATRIPAPPFTSPPPVFNIDPLVELTMDFQAKVGRLHALITNMAIDVRDVREATEGEADRLDREAELLHMVAAGARGVTDADLASLFDDEAAS